MATQKIMPAGVAFAGKPRSQRKLTMRQSRYISAKIPQAAQSPPRFLIS